MRPFILNDFDGFTPAKSWKLFKVCEEGRKTRRVRVKSNIIKINAKMYFRIADKVGVINAEGPHGEQARLDTRSVLAIRFANCGLHDERTGANPNT